MVSPRPSPVRRALKRRKNQIPLPRATQPESLLLGRAREPLEKHLIESLPPHLWHPAPKDFIREMDVGLDRVSQKDRQDTECMHHIPCRHFSTLLHLQRNDIIHTRKTDGEY